MRSIRRHACLEVGEIGLACRVSQSHGAKSQEIWRVSKRSREVGSQSRLQWMRNGKCGLRETWNMTDRIRLGRVKTSKK